MYRKSTNKRITKTSKHSWNDSNMYLKTPRTDQAFIGQIMETNGFVSDKCTTYSEECGNYESVRPNSLRS